MNRSTQPFPVHVPSSRNGGEKMAEYVGLLAASVFLGIPLCSKKAGKWGRAVYCAALAVIFIVISASRFLVGYDFAAYGKSYFDMKYLDAEDVMVGRFEKGFIMPLYILSLGYDEYYHVFIYTSIIIYSTVFYLIYKNSSCPWVSAAAYLCLGLYFNSLCFLRQVMAALVAAYAVKYAVSGKHLRFFAFIFVAASFHWSALIMLLMYCFLKIKPSWIYLGIMTAATVGFCFVSKPIMFWVIDHFYMYQGYDPVTSPEANQGLSPKYTVMFGLLLIAVYFFKDRLLKKNPANAVYINCLMFTVIFEAMGMRHAILSRFAIIAYIPGIVYLVPDLACVVKDFCNEKFKSDEKRRGAAQTAAIALACAYGAGNYLMLMYGNYNGVVPYVSQQNRPYDIFVDMPITEEDEDFDTDEDVDFEVEDEEYEDYDEESLNEEIMGMLG